MNARFDIHVLTRAAFALAKATDSATPLEDAAESYLRALVEQSATRVAVAEHLCRRFGKFGYLETYDEQSQEGWRHDADDVLRVLAADAYQKIEMAGRALIEEGK